MFTERTTIGLDVHARSVVAAALDTHTGELVTRTLTPDSTDITNFINHQPQPAAAVYEAGPTGFGLARHLAAANIRCVVAAPSKLQRPAGDRVKTDKNDALHLAKLLRLDEVTPVDVPSLVQESARDLVRTREDARGDLMSARHRLSKLLLRHGIVYYGGSAWTGKHDQWLQAEALPRLPNTSTRLAFDAAYDAVLTVTGRRDRLDAEITKLARDCEFTDVVDRLGWD
ncbi:transposase [Brevibacterium sp. S22]|uniref:IS110 family transposase n=1 Tax=Brevibacterium sp. S22 TaxID=2483794 RepID=UPI0010920393|nr:transposase [Brevibacterium sp. S22]TGD27636.1 transposase [Brevibacterium sp. S22]